MKIAVIGMGYVGLSMSCLLARKHEVVAADILPQKVQLVNSGVSPIADPEIETALATGTLRLTATTDTHAAIEGTDAVVIAVSADYDTEQGYFDTSAVEDVLDVLEEAAYEGLVVIRSTVPIGYTLQQASLRPTLRIVFSPEFLREGQALYDNLHPSRIVVGVPGNDNALMETARGFARQLADCAEEQNVPVRIIGSSEAEAIKLFSNAYLALRVSFFNELDTYAHESALDTREIIEGVGLDPRIGSHYNNPSFGYGGYCLPKDSKQLLANYKHIPQSLIGAIVSSNATRKDFIAADVAAREPKLVGIYHLAMKEGSDNYRHSSILGVMERLAQRGIPMLVYDPACSEDEIVGAKVTDDLASFKASCDLILCNRYEDVLSDVADKVYTRDLGF